MYNILWISDYNLIVNYNKKSFVSSSIVSSFQYKKNRVDPTDTRFENDIFSEQPISNVYHPNGTLGKKNINFVPPFSN